MMRTKYVLLGLAACIALAPAASAAEYMFSYTSQSGTFESGFGDIFTNASNDVMSISGTAAGPTSQSGMITGTSDYASADNIFTASSPYVDSSGLSFSTSNGVDYNLYEYDGVYRVSDSISDPSGGAAVTSDSPVTLTVEAVTPAPEPSMWALMIAGVAMIGGMLRFGRPREALATA
jgi:hypothetical protein